MTENTRTESDLESLSSGIKILKASVPATEFVLNAYIPVAEARLHAMVELDDWNGFILPKADPITFEQGRPLLAEMPLPDFEKEFNHVALNMAKALKKGLPELGSDLNAVLATLESAEASKKLALAIWDSEPDILNALCKETSMPLKAALLTGSSAMEVFLALIHKQAAPLIKDLRWIKGYCPICGSFPDMALFRKSGIDDPYLKSHGGQRWLHCSSCGHEWRFKRGACAFCETEKHEELRYLQSEERPNERIDVCDKCKRYLINIDSREFIKEPDLRIAAKAYIHLDIIAQKKGYMPLTETGWNSI